MDKSEQKQLLDKMYSFYKKRYSDKELEKKFNSACEDIISSDDVSISVYMEFCIDNDIEPTIKKRRKSSPSSSSDWGGGCGRPSSRNTSC